MTPDINTKGFYLQFITNAKKDIESYKESIEANGEVKEQLYNYIATKKDLILNDFNIDLDNYEKEWIDKQYTTAETLNEKVRKIVYTLSDHPNRIILLQVIKYCAALKQEYKYNRLIILAHKRKNIKYGEYVKYITAYYNKVHECVLNGMGYKYSYGIGVFVINYWKLDRSKLFKTRMVDFAATAAAKKEILDKGLIPYDEKEADWYKMRNLPYHGVKYKVYKEDNHYYEFTFIKSDIFTRSSLQYKKVEYVATKYRGMGYEKMAEVLCPKIEDVYNLQVDIKYKLNIILHKDPTKYLNFIRNEDQLKYKRGAHSR